MQQKMGVAIRFIFQPHPDRDDRMYKPCLFYGYGEMGQFND